MDEKKVAIITGSTKGIGRGIAQELAKNNITVVITSRDPNAAIDVAESIKAGGGDAIGLPFNLEDSNSFAPLIEATVEKCGRLDILINNACSQSCLVPLAEATQQQIEFTMTANVSNTLYLSKLAHPHLKHSRGSIVNVSSVVVNRSLLGLPFYAIVKGAVVQMTKVLAAEWASDNVRVNAINPGFVRTSAFSDMGMPPDLVDKNYEFYQQYHALDKIGTPEDIGKYVAYLTSDDASFVTGSVLDIDGGYSVRAQPLFPMG